MYSNDIVGLYVNAAHHLVAVCCFTGSVFPCVLLLAERRGRLLCTVYIVYSVAFHCLEWYLFLAEMTVHMHIINSLVVFI